MQCALDSKAKVEAGVRFAQSYILGRLRHQTFFSLAEANRAIVLVLERMNAHVMRRLGLNRSDLFASVERPALRALPATDYEFAEWRLARVGLDYHVEIEGFYYSVPHALIRAQVDVRITALLHHITTDLLKRSYLSLDRDSAPGIDGVTWQTYGENFEQKLEDLHDKVHRGSYRARPARLPTFRRLMARNDR